METDLLKTFSTVADARSFSKAAEMLYSTQSTVSRQIARLEEILDARLFVRYGRHVELTTAGELLLPLAAAIVTRTEDAVGIIREQAGGGPSNVHFGAVPMVMAHILVPLLAPFFAAYPGMSIDLMEKDDAQLEEAVISGELDCGVMTPWGSARVSAYHLLTEELLLIVPREHPLAELKAAPYKLAATDTILLPRATIHVSNLIVEAFRKRGLSPKFSARCNYPELNKELVRKGLGLAPMPITLCSPAALDGLVAVPFEEPLTRDLHLIYPQNRALSAAARALIAYIRTHVPKQRLFEGRA
jgi:LysR family transcriptional regulator, transcription activator of glutamate synthase operon